MDEHIIFQGVGHPYSMGIEASVIVTLLDLTLCTSSSGYSSISFISKCFPEFCELFQQIIKCGEWVLWELLTF